jgi:putative sterol carrier protein
MATVEEITARLQTALSGQAALTRTITVDLKGEGFIHIAGGQVTNEDAPADTTIIVSREDLENMVRGELDPTMAFMQGKLKINGDMSVALQLQPLLAAARG